MVTMDSDFGPSRFLARCATSHPSQVEAGKRERHLEPGPMAGVRVLNG